MILPQFETLTDPTAAFGILLANEAGLSAPKMAKHFKCSESHIRKVMAAARNGELERVPGIEGLGFLAPDEPATEGEILCRRWQRRICLHLVQHGEIQAQTILDMVPDDGHRHIGSTAAIETIAAGLRPKRVHFKPCAGGWRIEAADRELLRVVIRSGWRKDALLRPVELVQ